MKNSLLPVNDINLSCRIESLLGDAYYDKKESTQLQDFRKLFDWEERFFISYLSRDGKDGVIRYDTIYEMKEVYEFLDRMEAFLDTKINRLSSGKPFEHWLKVHSNYLPSPKQRWCTRVMKIKPFEEFIGDDDVVSYIGIRADENRQGYQSSKESIQPVFPFVEDGIMRGDVFEILDKSVGVPKYYDWRSRSGCGRGGRAWSRSSACLRG